jgi:hypothetical protein
VLQGWAGAHHDGGGGGEAQRAGARDHHGADAEQQGEHEGRVALWQPFAREQRRQPRAVPATMVTFYVERYIHEMVAVITR